MIKFFRKLRLEALSRKRIPKYLLYATGEIVLVVIGILIALNINNWNENRKLLYSKQELLVSLKKEATINKENLEGHLVGLHKNNAQVNKLINYSAGSIELPIDSLRLYASHVIYPYELSLLNSVLDEAITSGKLALLSDSLKQKLSLLKDYSNSRKKINDLRTEISFDANGLNTDFYLYLNTIMFSSDGIFDVQNKISRHPDFVMSDEEFMTYIKSPDAYKKLTIEYSNSVLDEVWLKYALLRLTTETIDLIDRELKGKRL
jgi:hypothetical protein